MRLKLLLLFVSSMILVACSSTPAKEPISEQRAIEIARTAIPENLDEWHQCRVGSYKDNNGMWIITFTRRPVAGPDGHHVVQVNADGFVEQFK